MVIHWLYCCTVQGAATLKWHARAQIAREAHLACAHSAPRPLGGGRGGPFTPPMSPSGAGGHLPLDALLMGFSASSAGGGESSSPEHTGPHRGTPLDGGPLAGLPPFPNFGDDLNFIQVRRCPAISVCKAPQRLSCALYPAMYFSWIQKTDGGLMMSQIAFLG